MRLTVGPLPPAVYWRRRVVVLGAGLLFLLVLFYSLNGPDKSSAIKGGPSQSASPEQKPTAVFTPDTEAPPPNGDDDTGDDAGDAGGSDASASPTSEAGDGPANIPPARPPADGACTDDEISVIPVASPSSVRRGETVDLRLKIKNISDRTCSRDVGADLQEVYIRLGAKVVWSSDTCGTARGRDVQPLSPNIEREYQAAWNGNEASKCARGVATGSPVEAGQYQVFGRLGTKHSEPVKLTISN